MSLSFEHAEYVVARDEADIALVILCGLIESRASGHNRLDRHNSATLTVSVVADNSHFNDPGMTIMMRE